jgi:hypothetical protein
MAKKQTRETFSSKNIIVFILAILLVAALSFGIIVLIKQIQADRTEKDAAHDTNTANSILQTEDDLKDENKVADSSNDAKDRMEADEKAKADAAVEMNESGLKIAKPEISFVATEDDKIAAGGAIYNINETDGTCTFTFRKGDVEISASGKTLPNPGYISCETVRVDKSKFTSGSWQVTIKYKSNTAEGESEAKSYTIQ